MVGLQHLLVQMFTAGRLTVNKTKRPFSAIACDHAHEQMNAYVKGTGGVVGLTENNQALLRWMIAGPEITRVVAEFESSVSPDCESETGGHHEQTASGQGKFLQHVACLTETIENMGNPFLDESSELFAIDTKIVLDAKVVDTVRSAEAIGLAQYNLFINERLVDCTSPVSEPLKQNKLKIFKDSVSVRKSGNKGKLATARNDCSLFSRLFIACQARDGDLDDFFQHENQSCPPALSSDGKLRSCNKSDLLGCLETIVSSQQQSPDISVIVTDGAALVNMLAPHNCKKTFEDYALKIFFATYLAKTKPSQKIRCCVGSVFSRQS